MVDAFLVSIVEKMKFGPFELAGKLTNYKRTRTDETLKFGYPFHIFHSKLISIDGILYLGRLL